MSTVKKRPHNCLYADTKPSSTYINENFSIEPISTFNNHIKPESSDEDISPESRASKRSKPELDGHPSSNTSLTAEVVSTKNLDRHSLEKLTTGDTSLNTNNSLNPQYKLSHTPPLTPINLPSFDLATPTPSQSTSPSENSTFEGFSGYEIRDTKRPKSSSNYDTRFDPLQLSTSSLDSKFNTNGDLQRTISHQFDLEILLKHHELRIIEDEIAKTHILMLQLRKHSSNPMGSIENDKHTYFTDIYAKYLDKDVAAKTNIHHSDTSDIRVEQNSSPLDRATSADISSENSSTYQAPLTRSKSSQQNKCDSSVDTGSENIDPTKRQSRLRGGRASEIDQKSLSTGSAKLQCILRRNDGILVRLICPRCKRENFFSPQGFINHCRISHSLEFTSHDAAAVVCGVEYEIQDEIGLAAQKENEEKKRLETETSTSQANRILPNNVGLTSKSTSLLNVNPSSAYMQHKISMSAIPDNKAIDTNNLASFLKTKNMDVNLDELIKSSIENYPKAYLLDNEDDDEQVLELGDEATPFERALAEAKKLKINIDEIRKTPSQTTATGSAKRQNKRKKGGSRARRSMVKQTKPTVESDITAEEQVSKSLITSKSIPSRTLRDNVGGKYKPGTAPSHWNSISGITPPTKSTPGSSMTTTCSVISSEQDACTTNEVDDNHDFQETEAVLPNAQPAVASDMLSKKDKKAESGFTPSEASAATINNKGSLSKFLPLSRFF